ncbi:hypothetical protein ACLOJK_003040 [Asimina triloba]
MDWADCVPVYLDNGWVSIGCPLIVSYLYTVMLQNMTEEDLDDINKYEKLISLMGLIFRLSDDLATSKEEMERGDVAKSIQCYMHEAKVSEEIAREHVKHLIDDAWKELNEEYCLKSSHLHRSFVNAVINVARGGSFLYNHGDGFGRPSLEADLQAQLEAMTNKYEKLFSLMGLIFHLCDDLATSKVDITTLVTVTRVTVGLKGINREHMHMKHLIDGAWKELNEECLKAVSSERVLRPYVHVLMILVSPAMRPSMKPPDSSPSPFL